MTGANQGYRRLECAPLAIGAHIDIATCLGQSVPVGSTGVNRRSHEGSPDGEPADQRSDKMWRPGKLEKNVDGFQRSATCRVGRSSAIVDKMSVNERYVF